MITGAPETIDGQQHLVLTRTFRAPIEDVWAALTESERLGRWFATWTGDPATGPVDVRWIHEEGQPVERYAVEVCEAPHRLRVSSVELDPGWTLGLSLDDEGGVTTLRFAQVLTDPAMVTDVGPGWEFYLDRLEESVRTGEAATIWSEGYQAKSAEYAAAFGLPHPDDALLTTALAQVGELVEAGVDRAGEGTPCDAWTVRRLSEHLVTTTETFARSLRGEAVDWTAPAAPVDGDVAQAFGAAADALVGARAALGEAAEPPDWQLAELAVHTWDLATALGVPTDGLDQAVAQRGGAFMRAHLTESNRGEAFGPPREAPEGADAYTSIAAFAGRSVPTTGAEGER